MEKFVFLEDLSYFIITALYALTEQILFCQGIFFIIKYMRKFLNQNFSNQPTLRVAENLLGKFLVRKYKNKEIAVMVIEVEAYDGLKDKASHAHKGKTERNKIMFGKSGRFYVYFTYGIHWMLNIVTGPKNYPAAILIRGGIVHQKNNDNSKKPILLNGPAKLTKYLKIDKKFNNKTAGKKTGLWLEDRGIKITRSQIKKSKRIGVEYAGKWADKLYRFSIDQSVK